MTLNTQSIELALSWAAIVAAAGFVVALTILD
jgi:hypothetical protein